MKMMMIMTTIKTIIIIIIIIIITTKNMIPYEQCAPPPPFTPWTPIDPPPRPILTFECAPLLLPPPQMKVVCPSFGPPLPPPTHPTPQIKSQLHHCTLLSTQKKTATEILVAIPPPPVLLSQNKQTI